MNFCWDRCSRAAVPLPKRWRSWTPPICPRRLTHIKKRGGAYTAHRATTGGRSRKDGQSRYFVGYKKHTLRLWLRQHAAGVLLAPLMSWIAPANRDDSVFLAPSLQYCARHLEWTPDIVVGDMAYVNMFLQRRLREDLHVALVTKLKPNMVLPAPFEAVDLLRCPQGQVLHWLGLEPRDQLHWYGVTDPEPLCRWCWQQSVCAREFSFPPSAHEIVLGTIPVGSRVGQRLLRQARSWIEAAQSYEKNQLGLSQLFLNSLRLTWVMGLLADTVTLLRALAITTEPKSTPLLQEMLPRQMPLDLWDE